MNHLITQSHTNSAGRHRALSGSARQRETVEWAWGLTCGFIWGCLGAVLALALFHII